MNHDNSSSLLSSVPFSWNIVCDCEVEKTLSGKHGEIITLTVNDESQIGKKVDIQILIGNSVVSEKQVTIADIL